jgi:hypothetical protein
MFRRIARGLTPTGFVLAALCFFLAFAVVSCDAPGGYGRSAPGGQTVYTGIDLAVGDAPQVDPEHLRPPAEQQPDELDPQLLAIAALMLLLVGAVVTVVRDAWVRRAASAVIAALAAILLAANQGTTEALLAAKLQAQLSVPMPAGKTADDFVQTGNGFGLAALLTVAVFLGNLIGWWRAHRAVNRPPPAVAAEPTTVETP